MNWTPPTTLTPEMQFDLPFEQRVLSHIVERWVERDPDRVCIVQDDGQQVTYAELDQRASAIARGLCDLGVGVGDRVATLLANDLRVIYVGLALCKLGAIEVPVNPALVGASLSHLIGDSSPKVAVVNPAFVEGFEAAVPEGQQVLLVQGAAEGDEAATTEGPSIDAMLAAGAEPLPTAEEVGPHLPAIIMYTSGTTGLPKGALLPHGHTYQAAARSAGALRLTTEDTLITILPMFHAGGRYMNVGACLLTGAKCGMVRKFSGADFWDQAFEFGATAMQGIVTVGHFLLAQEPSPRDREHSITRAMLTPCPPSFEEEFGKRFGISVFEGYGNTESNIPAMNLDGPGGSAGKVYAPFRVRIVDELDRPVPPGTTGEIVVSCDEPWSVFLGYWGQPETTLETVRNFGVHSGDAGYLDADGHLWFVDRIKDMIRRRGENVPAVTVEEAVRAVDVVAECAAYPLPSKFGEEEIAVAVVLKPGAEIGAAEIVDRCRADLPGFALPRYVRFVDQLPMTPTGKVQKFKLKQLGAEGADDLVGDAR